MEQRAKRGDIIEWSFEDSDKHHNVFRGKTYQAEVAAVDEVAGDYCVYAEYGADLIPFDQAKVINRKPVKKNSEESTNCSNNDEVKGDLI